MTTRTPRQLDELQHALMAAGKIRVTWRDDEAPHQIRQFLCGAQSGRIAVSCTCLKTSGGSFAPIETRTRWETAEALAAWREHLAGADDIDSAVSS